MSLKNIIVKTSFKHDGRWVDVSLQNLNEDERCNFANARRTTSYSTKHQCSNKKNYTKKYMSLSNATDEYHCQIKFSNMTGDGLKYRYRNVTRE